MTHVGFCRESGAAYWDTELDFPTVVKLGWEETNTMPSVVHWPSADMKHTAPIVGHKAVAEAQAHPHCSARNAKRLIGRR